MEILAVVFRPDRQLPLELLSGEGSGRTERYLEANLQTLTVSLVLII